ILMAAGSLLTGLAIYKPTQLHVLTALLGGYEMARWFHFWLTMAYVGFFLVHVAQVIRAGWNNFRAMIIGYQILPGELGKDDEVPNEHHISTSWARNACGAPARLAPWLFSRRCCRRCRRRHVGMAE